MKQPRQPKNEEEHPPYDMAAAQRAVRQEMLNMIQSGDRVSITNPTSGGKALVGRATMKSVCGGWVLNLGGKHGTPALADVTNIIQVFRPRK